MNSTFSPPSEAITVFNISFFLLSVISNTPRVKQSNKVLSYVFSCSSRASNIQRKSLQHSWPITCIPDNHQTAPGGALETYAYCRCCHMGLMQGKTAPKGWLLQKKQQKN